MVRLLTATSKMTPEQEKYFDNYFDLFINTGWKQYIEETQASLDLLKLENAKNWDEFLSMKSRRKALLDIINFEQLMRDYYDSLKERDLDIHESI